MQYLKLARGLARPQEISLIVAALKAGQVVVLPTDTIYGLSCMASDLTAVQKIYRLKRRQPERSLIVLVSSLKMARSFAKISSKKASLLAEIWLRSQRPTTVILPGSRLPNINPQSLALRLPKSDLLIKIIRRIGQPIVSTSLNISGQEEISRLDRLFEVWPDKRCQPDLVVDVGPNRKKRPSRILDMSGERTLVIRR